MFIIEQITSKQRAEAIIDSCETQEHFDAAEKYVELYYAKYEDYLGYRFLLSHHKQMRLKSLGL